MMAESPREQNGTWVDALHTVPLLYAQGAAAAANAVMGVGRGNYAGCVLALVPPNSAH